MIDKQRAKLPTLVGGVVVVLCGILLASIALLSPAEVAQVVAADGDDAPSHVEAVEGSDVARVTLSQRAAERLDIQTAPAQHEQVAGEERLVIPYTALMYDADGGTWTYTNPEPLVFVRAAVAVDSIEGERVVLDSGPEVGTPVVVVGAAELFGAEFGVGH